MEVEWDVVAGSPVRLVIRITKAVGRAGGHRSGGLRRQVLDHGLQPVFGVVNGHREAVTLVHEQPVVGDCERAAVEVDRVRRTRGLAALGQVGEVRILEPADLRSAREVQRCPVDGILRKAPEHHCNAPSLGGAAGRKVARWIELEFQESLARSLREGFDVAVAVRGAGLRLLRIRARIADDHPEPESWVKLEVPGCRCAACRVGHRRRLRRQRQLIRRVVASARTVRVEKHARLIVADVVLESGVLPVLYLETTGIVLAIDDPMWNARGDLTEGHANEKGAGDERHHGRQKETRSPPVHVNPPENVTPAGRTHKTLVRGLCGGGYC